MKPPRPPKAPLQVTREFLGTDQRALHEAIVLIWQIGVRKEQEAAARALEAETPEVALR